MVVVVVAVVVVFEQHTPSVFHLCTCCTAQMIAVWGLPPRTQALISKQARVCSGFLFLNLTRNGISGSTTLRRGVLPWTAAT